MVRARHGFRIRSCGDGVTRVAARSGLCFARHTHDDFGFGVLTGGAQRSWSGRGPVEAGPGDVITVNPGEVHDGMPVGSERAWTMLYVPPGTVSQIARDLRGGARPEFPLPVIRDPRIARLIAAACTTAASDGPGLLEEHLLMSFAALLGVATLPPAAPRRLRQALERIDDDPAAAHALADLALLAGLSRFQLLRAFVRMTGLTPHAYVVQRRLDLARRTLRGGAAPAEAAAAAGFADQSHLHRAFVARYGLTPGRYGAAFARRRAISFKSAAPPSG